MARRNRAVAGRPTENENSRRRAPGAPDAVPAAARRSLTVTKTRSPAANGRATENAVPRWWGCALSRPACKPLRDPTTLTDAIWFGETAGRSTLVPGAASGVPGNGNTSSPCEDEPVIAFEERAPAGAGAASPRVKIAVAVASSAIPPAARIRRGRSPRRGELKRKAAYWPVRTARELPPASALPFLPSA